MSDNFNLPNGFTAQTQQRQRVSANYGTNFATGTGAPAASQRSYAYVTSPTPTEKKTQFDPDELGKIAQQDRRWAWVEVDLGAIRHNASEVKRAIGRGCRLMAVVKADAYGHGAVQVAKAALSAGADYLAVATVNEGIELREALVNAPILLLAEPPQTAIELLLGYKIMPAIYSTEFAVAYAEAADEHGIRAPYHLAVNTGMNRIGVHYKEVVEFMQQVDFHRALDLVGTFTHFATADCPETLDFQIQLKHFLAAVDSMREAGFDPGIVHCANSAASIRYPDARFDMVRLGISLYGYHPCPETKNLIDLVPAMTVKARITDVRMVPMSEGVSYGLHYRSPGSVKICTVPLGYADGLSRALSGRTEFLLGGRRCKQVGNICMDQCMFEVDMRSFAARQRLDPQVGDEVIIAGAQGGSAQGGSAQGDSPITITDLATKLGTIEHEVCIGFSHRLPRVYV